MRKLAMITRCDYETTRGYWVRFQAEGANKLFSDKKLGGKSAALAAAIAWRDKKWKQLGHKRTNHHTKDKRSTTGVVGVTYVHQRNQNGYLVRSYRVTYCPAPYTNRAKSYSIKKYGKQRAFEMACDIRKIYAT